MTDPTITEAMVEAAMQWMFPVGANGYTREVMRGSLAAALRAAPPAEHPDTLRLDWLTKCDSAFHPSLRVIRNSLFYGPTLRDDIDAARAASGEGT